MSIKITDEMFSAAKAEAEKRESQGHINHHFSLEYMSDWDRNVLGFLGEFAGRKALGFDWKKGIRADYLTPDEGDIIFEQQIVDIKTETIPEEFFGSIVRRKYSESGKKVCKDLVDDFPYGRRLICEDQADLLTKYNYVLWCVFIREKYEKWINKGHPCGNELPECYILGYCDAEFIRNHYEVQTDKPYGNKPYPVPCLAIRTSDLQHFYGLKNVLKND